jgi:hypothetical protein
VCALAVALVVGAVSPAHAERVVLADRDPQLVRAVEAALRPWRVDIVVVGDAVPRDAADARARAAASSARFVVWRDGGELVVYDDQRGELERRAAQAGAFDDAGAAAAALTVKTMLRLPAPPDVAAVGAPEPPPIRETPPWLRVELAAVTRYDAGVGAGARAGGAVLARPAATLGLRVGASAELGAAAAVDQAGFAGSWSSWTALAVAGWTVTAGDRGAWEIEPRVAIGALHGELAGTLMRTPQTTDDWFVDARVGVAVRRRFGALAAGAIVTADAVPGAATYIKPGTSAQEFAVPTTGVAIGLVVSGDLAP